MAKPRCNLFYVVHVVLILVNHSQVWGLTPELTRRKLVKSIGSGLAGLVVVVPSVSSAGEVGARITKAVTTSDVGIAVRRSVVQGAQNMDAIDGEWERFSDKFNLGSARKSQSKPPPKVIPDPKALNIETATKLLEVSDEAFLSAANVDRSVLDKQIDRVAELVQGSFSRSGLSQDDAAARIPNTAAQLNYLSYVHFKAYSDIIIERKVDFRAFKQEFDGRLGASIVLLLFSGLPQLETKGSPSATLKYQLRETIARINYVGGVLIDRGLVSLVEVSALEADSVSDWSEDLADIQFSVSFDGDVNLQSQLLLQEQGFRLYPNYARYAVQALVNEIAGQSISVMDYYMDPSYDSDPAKFDPKEVLLDIVLESK